MIVACPSCRRQFRLDDGRVRPGSKLRCARCGHTFAARPDGAPERPAPASELAPVGGDAPLVLLADGNRPVRSLLRPLLAGLGFRVETADDGTAAFKAVVARHPAAIVASVHLGGLSGVAICEGVKGSPHLKDTRVAILGSNLSADLFNRDTALAYGADLYLEETMSEESLRAVLAALVPRPPAAGPDRGDREDEAMDDRDGGDLPGPGHAEEEIRRLARLMLSDLKLYNPDRFAQALRTGQVLEIFKGELARGRDLVDQRFPELPARQDLLQSALRDGIARETATGSGTRTG